MSKYEPPKFMVYLNAFQIGYIAALLEQRKGSRPDEHTLISKMIAALDEATKQFGGP